jgi:DNA-3-methyladenine glycosylase
MRKGQTTRQADYLDAEFFAGDTLAVAREMIGAVLIAGQCRGKIVEAEAYTTDEASHFVTRSRQGALMRETFGQIYVYLTYGMYYCLNITTERDGVGAVLIRAVEPLDGIDTMIERRGVEDIGKLASGPGRLAQAFGIGLELNGRPIGREIKIFRRRSAPDISTSRRVGISKAIELEWRFYETGSPFVSKFKKA